MKALSVPAKGFVALLFSLSVLVGTAGSAAAAPTAEFTFSPSTATVAKPVTFTFTGTCDLAPCRIQWRWFQAGGTSLGTAMGEGPLLTYAFDAAGTYSVVAKITNASPTHAFATATHAVRVRATYQDDNRRVGYNTWRGAVSIGASGGGYRVATGSTATATLAFSGTGITYVARTGPNAGIAALTVDGTMHRSVDLYTPKVGFRSVALTRMAAGSHRIVLAATGTKNTASTGTAVTLDEFVAKSTHYDDSDFQVGYDSWVGVQSINASSGTVRSSASPHARTLLTFTGTAVTWLSMTGPDQGLASILIDGAKVATLDNFTAARVWKVRHSYGGLTPGPHTIAVVVLGTHNVASSASAITSDAFAVQ